MKCPVCENNKAEIHQIYGVLPCGSCNARRAGENAILGPLGGYPEFVPQRVHDDRRKHLADQIQSHRQGILSKEWMELYPDRAKGSIDSGTISQEEVKKAEYTWKDLPNYNNLKKTKQ